MDRMRRARGSVAASATARCADSRWACGPFRFRRSSRWTDPSVRRRLPGSAAVQRWRIKAHRPRPYTLPWEKPEGRHRTVNLLFRWSDDRHLRARLYNDQIWRPALVTADLAPPPAKDSRGRLRYANDRHDGMHALRHYYASALLADGVSIRELAEYLGHSDPGFTLRTYIHMLPDSHERAIKAVDARHFRLDR